MRGTGIIVIILLILAAVYFGWVRFSTSDGTDSSKVTVTIDKDKIREDKEKIVEKADDLSEKTREKVNELTDKPATTQP